MTNLKFKHRKTGGDYRVVGVGKVQVADVLADMDNVVIYMGEDGQLWVRPVLEFFDGRFEELENDDMSERPWAASKCPCGHRACSTYVLSNQGSVGFTKGDAEFIADVSRMGDKK